MSVLPDWMIERDISITPLEWYDKEKQRGKISWGITSYGVDVRLGYKFKVFKAYPCHVIDPKNFDQRMMEDVDLTPVECINPFSIPCSEQILVNRCKACQYNEKLNNYIDIPPHSFILGESLETFKIPRDVLCIVMGKSTYARCGIYINVTPGEPEWEGKWTIEISNTTPLPARVYAGEGIMQCIFLRSDSYTQAAIEHIDKGEDKDYWMQLRYKNSCRTSYADKKGKYQSQTGLTMPTVDKDNKPG